MPQFLPYVALGSVVLLMLWRSPRDPTTKQALAWSAAWLGLASLFGLGILATRGTQRGLEYFTAYFVEQALSIDNLFVMILVFARLKIPRARQNRVLTWGIAGVVILRGLMIVSGTALVAQFHVLTYILGAFLLFAAYKLARELGKADDPDDAPANAPTGSRIRRILARLGLPVTDEVHGDRFTIVRAGVRYATPLLLALVTIEIADAVFALDSIPAVFGITTDPFVAFTSNLFAVLGLRSLYFALAGLLDKLRYLKHGLVGVLGVVGTKMLVSAVVPVPTWLSLVLVALTLGGAIVASLMSPTTPEIAHAE